MARVTSTPSGSPSLPPTSPAEGRDQGQVPTHCHPWWQYGVGFLFLAFSFCILPLCVCVRALSGCACRGSVAAWGSSPILVGIVGVSLGELPGQVDKATTSNTQHAARKQALRFSGLPAAPWSPNLVGIQHAT